MSSLYSQSVMVLICLALLFSVVYGATWSVSTAASCGGTTVSGTGASYSSGGTPTCSPVSGISGTAAVSIVCTSSSTGAATFYSSSTCAASSQTGLVATTAGNVCVAAAWTSPPLSYQSGTLNCNSAPSSFYISLPLMALLALLVFLVM